MADRRSAIVGELERGLHETRTLFEGFSPADWDREVYADGACWTVRQVLAHFVTIEGSMQRLFEDILAGGPGARPDFDLERFNRTQPRKLDGLPREEVLARFEAVRRRTMALVAGMGEADLDREGLHPFHGRGSLERFIRWAYEHARLHEEDLRQALATGGASESH